MYPPSLAIASLVVSSLIVIDFHIEYNIIYKFTLIIIRQANHSLYRRTQQAAMANQLYTQRDKSNEIKYPYYSRNLIYKRQLL